MGLAGGSLACDAVLFGFDVGGFIRGGCAAHVALDPPHVAHHAAVAAGPAEGLGGGQGGGEVAGEAGEVCQAAPGGRGEAAAAVGDQLHPPAGVLGPAEVSLGFGQVVDGHLL
ncbi:hypothetical protein ACWDWU_30175 [Streptomyces sp. NPDC003442]